MKTYRNYHLGLGSNQGNRAELLKGAIKLLEQQAGTVQSCSRIYESRPMLLSSQKSSLHGNYLNAAVSLISPLEPKQLINTVLSIEKKLGRVRSVQERWGPRTIDIDLLFCEDLIIDSDKLILPHPRICERDFVLRPLADIDPTFIHPVVGKSVQELLEEFYRQKKECFILKTADLKL
ncbi:MAG: 2-amino-4-hydroxy-6-hydroxymethyldihydropteridine diphosphokinase [Candidatus Dadabacteria bacterium]|nr:MAG: 2-amino-4-hydroxy-6-hydroxymethyldihydropteridine diphosphokinase [Candidatus Dadabacteria bacterium]